MSWHEVSIWAYLWDGAGLLFTKQELWLPLVIGLGAGVVLYFLIIRKSQWFLTFDHELAHAVMALLFFRRIRTFRVTSYAGGLVRHSGGFGGKFGNLMIQLAPYFLPTFTMFAVLALPLISRSWLFHYYIFTGFTVMFHILSTADELALSWHKSSFTSVEGETMQSDIGKAGYIAAFLLITGFTLLFYGLAIHLIIHGYPGIIPFMKAVFLHSWVIYTPLAIYVATWLKGFIAKMF
ncbi:MAG: M50 family metallopeptidase [Bacteroidetes bacterium]|nr:M50 family metallopeptidase [Bacteroidota bacterium]